MKTFLAAFTLLLLTASSAAITCDSGSLSDTCLVNSTQSVNDGTTISGTGSLLVGLNGRLENTGNRNVFAIEMDKNVTIRSGGTIRGNVNITAENLTVESGGSIDASGLGYLGGPKEDYYGSGNGPGGGDQNDDEGGGGGYGGKGGDSETGLSGGSVYDSLVNPFSYGSGGGGGWNSRGGHGGGIIRVDTAHKLNVSGPISVRGESTDFCTYSRNCGGGGSGGTLSINTSTLSGTSQIKAGGGDAGADGGGGGGGRIMVYADEVLNHDIDVSGGSGSGGGQNGNPGTFLTCKGSSPVSCPGSDGSGVNLSASYSPDANNVKIERVLRDDWTSTYVNWTALSTGQGTTATYTIEGLQTNYKFALVRNGSAVSRSDSGSDGTITVSADLSSFHTFTLGEGYLPEWNTQVQNSDLVESSSGNELSSEIRDDESGLSEVVLATNESGTWENKTSTYSKTFSQPTSWKWANFSWSNSSVNGVVGWKAWIRDDVGNWKPTPVKSFKADGLKPSLWELHHESVVDVDDGTANVRINASDLTLDQVLIEDDSSGSLTNSSMNAGSGDTYAYTVTRSTPAFVDFRVYADDLVDHVNATPTSTIGFKNISVSEELDAYTLNSSETVTVSGYAELLPDNTDVSGTLNLWKDAGDGFTLVNSQSLSSGSYSLQDLTEVAGTHRYRVNVTNDNGISGTNKTSFNVTLDVSSPSAVFNSTGNAHVDVDSADQDVNLTSYVSNSTDSLVDSAWATAESPTGTSKTYFLQNTESRDSSQTWFKTVDVSTEFGSGLGQYNVTYAANTSRGIGSDFASTSFYIENVSVSENLNDSRVNPGDAVEVSGTTLLQPYSDAVAGRNVSIWTGGAFAGNFTTDSSGGYSGILTAPESAGNQTIKVNATDANGIAGFNTTTLSVFNLSSVINGADNYAVYKDDDGSSPDPDITFNDTVTSVSGNPGDLYSVNMVYDVPSNWTFLSNNQYFGTMSPGETQDNDPAVDIGKSAELGPQQVTATSNTENGITSSDSITIEVWSKSIAQFTNPPNIINRNEDFQFIRADVNDYYNGSGLENIPTRFNVYNLDTGEQNLTVVDSNATGYANFNWSVKDYKTGSYRIYLATEDKSSLFVNSSDKTFTTDIDILGVMQLGSYSQAEEAVYRKDSLTPGDTTITMSIDDSTGSDVSSADVSVNVNGTVMTCQTDSNGACTVTYNPPSETVPGNYTVEVNATKEDFDDFYYNDSINVRGGLSNTIDTDREIYTRGLGYNLGSTATNEFGTEVSGDSVWRFNDAIIASGDDAQWTVSPSISRGAQTLNVTTNRSYFDDDSASKEVEVYGLAEQELSPSSSTILTGTTINVTSVVEDANTSSAVEGMPVTFKVNDSVIETTNTNASGVADTQWTPKEGFYNLSTVIMDNKSIKYNVSNSIASSDIKIGKEIYLDSFSMTENELWRNDIKSPSSTTFKVNLSETSSTDEPVPAENTEVTFRVNDTEEVTCITGALGYCETSYNPDTVDVGNLTVEVMTNRSGWVDAYSNYSVVVKGLLTVAIDKPSSSIVQRGETVDLLASTTSSSEEVKVPVNWSYRDSKIAEGKNTIWDVSPVHDIVSGTLEVSVGGKYYEHETATTDLSIYGKSHVNYTSPYAETVGYGESPTITCQALDEADVGIENYPVEFKQNGTVFATSQTGSNGEATANWDVPDNITTYEVGCSIDNNQTLQYNISTPSYESTEFQTTDNVAPEVSNVSTPSEVDPGETVEILFNATDGVEVGDVWAVVEDPNNIDYTVDASALEGDTYRATFDTTDKPEGGYSVTAKAEDTSGNIGEGMVTFSVNPGGTIGVNVSEVEVQNVTLDQGQNVSVKVSIRANETADHANLTAASSSSEITNYPSKYECGNLSQGDYCNRSFTVEVAPGTSPNSYFSSFEAEWKDVNDDKTSIDTFTELKVQPFAQITEEKGQFSTGIRHGKSKQHTFIVNSTGNEKVADYIASYIDEGLPSEWVSLQNDYATSIAPFETVETVIEAEVPKGRAPGTYSGTVNFGSDNAKTVLRDVDVTVPENATYTVPSSLTASAIEGDSGQLTEIDVKNIGNVNYTLDSYIAGNASDYLSAGSIESIRQETNPLEVSYGETTSFQFPGYYEATITTNSTNPDYQEPEREVKLKIDVLEFKIGVKTNETLEMLPGNYSTVKYNVSVGGSLRTDNLTHKFYVNGTQAEVNNITADGENFTANLTLPEVPDARTHDLVIDVYDKENTVNKRRNVEDRFKVPDITPPEITNMVALDQELGENVTVNVTVTDNSLSGPEQVTATVKEPDGNTSTYELNSTGGNWSLKLVKVNDEGDYRANVHAEDSAGNGVNQTVFFRVANRTSFTGSMVNSAGEAEKMTATFKIPGSDKVLEKVVMDGDYNISLLEGKYDIEMNYSDNHISLSSAEIPKSEGGISMDEIEPVDAPSPSADARVMALGVDSSLNVESGTLELDYSEYKENVPTDRDLDEMALGRCKNYDYSNVECEGSWEVFNLSSKDIDKNRDTVTKQVPGFSVYTLFFPSEDDSTTDTQEEEDTQTTEDSASGGGSGDIGEQLEDIQDTLTENESEYASFGSSSISAKLKPGEEKHVSLSVSNKYDSEQTFNFTTSEVVSNYLETSESVTIDPRTSKDVMINVSIPAGEMPNSYSGYLQIKSSKIDNKLPVNVNILPPDKKLLDLSVDPVFSSVAPGESIKVETTLNNQGYARNVDVAVTLRLVDPDTNETLSTEEKTFAVGTTLTRVLKLQVPEDAPQKKYQITGSARYSNLEVPMVATAVTPLKVSTPFWQRTVMGVSYANAVIGFVLVLITSLIGAGLYQYKRKKELEKKRYLEKIDLDTIPSGGSRQAYIGQLAEIGTRTFVEIDAVKTHALVAGATGSGKTVTGQALVEEALKEGINVIVMDPTAQWSGFLRECNDNSMLQHYGDYGLSKTDAEAFDGNIRAVEPEQDTVDISKYLENDDEGQIIVFSMHKLDNVDMDSFVNDTIQQVFDANLPERNQLETIIVYDEAHRLLDKFGGDGEGLKQLERGAREFRKWGVGMIMISQVISDFPGEIRANIGTMVQMRTQYDNDLNRMKDKFGMDTVRSIAKAEVGSGMLHNSDYNHGRPYFVDFRPLLHSPHRLGDKELDKYEQYNRRIDDLKEKVDQLEEQEKDVYEYRSQLKLARRNLRKGSFNLVDVYLDELEEDLS